jgi:hypothetical protein
MNLKMPLLIFKDLFILRFIGAMRVDGRGSLIMTRQARRVRAPGPAYKRAVFGEDVGRGALTRRHNLAIMRIAD